VFLNAGAEHVIMIDKAETILDKAILTFTHTFYSRIWQPGSTVCDAFEQAVTDVRIANRSEEKKFLLQTRDGHECSNCPIFATCEKGTPQFNEHKTTLLDMPPKVLIIGRTYEQADLLVKLLAVDSSEE